MLTDQEKRAKLIKCEQVVSMLFSTLLIAGVTFAMFFGVYSLHVAYAAGTISGVGLGWCIFAVLLPGLSVVFCLGWWLYMTWFPLCDVSRT